MKTYSIDEYFVLHSNCIPVKGASRSLICDLQREKYFYIPNDLFEILKTVRSTRINKIYSSFALEDRLIVDEYFNYLLDNDLGFIDNEPFRFPEMSNEWDSPSKITNSIIDVDQINILNVDYVKAFQELSNLNCSCVQIRCFDYLKLSSVHQLLNLTMDSRIKTVRLFLKYEESIVNNLKNEILLTYKRIDQVIFFNAPRNSSESILNVQVIYLEIQNLDNSDCGQICTGSFSINISHFTESVNYNSCLNRKISLDSLGNIKNCPSQKDGFGNINHISFEDALKNQKFQSLWSIKKDDISICKDCEYRYICTDCRVFTENKNDNLSKPSKCTYDPYTATWA